MDRANIAKWHLIQFYAIMGALVVLLLCSCQASWKDGGGQDWKVGTTSNPCAPTCPKPEAP